VGVNTSHIDRMIANIESGHLYPLALLSATSANRNDVVKETAARLDLDARLLELLVNNTLKAFLHAWRSSLQPYADVDTWQRSYCPFCGNPPALAEIQGVERSRYLRCLQCGSRWPYPNMVCAFCGNGDYHSLGIIQLEIESHKYYAHTCDCCRRYIKTVATFEAIPAALLPAENLATLHLDALAIERGYK
jgi:FdhE protein